VQLLFSFRKILLSSSKIKLNFIPNGEALFRHSLAPRFELLIFGTQETIFISRAVVNRRKQENKDLMKKIFSRNLLFLEQFTEHS